MGNRDAAAVLNVTAARENADDDGASVEARAARHDTKRSSTGGTCIHFLTDEEAGDRIQAECGADFVRPARIKAK